ncbi:MAG: molybdate ABC transporter substrate-binding protein [Synechococcales cyanobacterium RU_4_20]|nr:molybdate ABC transporter substrate-binding protein [Synechococcales cyanobacterium RU_4_20]NJR68420.1 molybdate ABC transporter substrate-binding protein [Synechococcales cyanobacterium CRU_2_2]
MKRQFFLVLLSAMLGSFFLILGVQQINPEPAQLNTTLLVSAAASLREVMEEIKPSYQQEYPNVNLTFNFGASGALLRQIEQGAPADIFISAAQHQMDKLDQKGSLVPGTRSNLANNKLVLIVPKNSRSVSSFMSLNQPGIKRIAIGEPRSVPAGQYGEQVLQKLNLWKALKPKLVYANHVRQVLAMVESGNVDAGLVYATDAKISDKVKVVVIAANNFHSPIVYPMAVLRSSKNIETSKVLAQYLSNRETKNILRKYGFIVSQ